MFTATVSTVGGGRRTATSHWAVVAFLRAGGIGTPVLGPLVVKGADGACGVILLADGGGVAVPLAVAAASGFVGRVSGLDFPLAGEEEDMGAHFLTVLRGSGNNDRGGLLFRTGSGVRVQETGRGDFDALSILDGSFKVYEEAFAILWNVPQGEAMDRELAFIGGRSEGEPGGVADREAFVEAGSECAEERRVEGGGGGGGGP